MKHPPRARHNSPSPLVVSPYQPGTCGLYIESLPSGNAKTLLRAEFLLHQGKFAQATDVLQDAHLSGSPIEKACFDLCRIPLLMLKGEFENARAVQKKISRPPATGPTGNPQSAKAARLAAHSAECGQYFSLVSSALAGNLTDFERIERHNKSGDTTLGIMIACLDAYRSIQKGNYAYACGACDSIRLLAAQEHPLLCAYESIVHAASLMNCEAEEDAKKLYMQAFEILDADKLYLPLGMGYAFSCGLPEVCLRKQHRAAYREICSIYKEFVNSYARANATLPLSPLLSTAQLALLSPLESSVACLAATGRSNAEIAHFMGCTTHTVKYHLANIYTKLGISSRQELKAQAKK